MSIEKLGKVLRSARLKKNDRAWFERWIGWYGKYCGAGFDERIPVDRKRVIGFLRLQKSMGRQTWQRLQAVRAIEFYRTTVLREANWDLQDICETLAEFAEREEQARATNANELDVVGKIDPRESDAIQTMRRTLRVSGKKWNTDVEVRVGLH